MLMIMLGRHADADELTSPVIIMFHQRVAHRERRDRETSGILSMAALTFEKALILPSDFDRKPGTTPIERFRALSVLDNLQRLRSRLFIYILSIIYIIADQVNG